ncbi:MAG: UDP-N-acetylmuramate dehydrogenase, partial [Pyrinomonadaceae bacterium]
MNLPIKENFALAPLTTLKVGGAARFFVEAKTEAEVSEALLFAKNKNTPLLVLGGGSNVLISDAGFEGLVLKISLKGIVANRENEKVTVTAKAGEDWDDFVKFCVEEKLQGIECLSGIPGTVGGTPVQNVGAYGQEVSETIISVKVL